MIQDFAKHNTKYHTRYIGQSTKSRIAGHVELEDLLHIERNLDEEHVPAKTTAAVSNEYSPKWFRFEHLAIRQSNWHFDLELYFNI